MDITSIPSKNGKLRMEEILRSPQFKQALFDVQVEECERYLAMFLASCSPEEYAGIASAAVTK